MTEFITRNHGHSCFEVWFKTTDPEHYKAIQDFARRLIDHQKPVTDNNVGSKWIPVTERLPEEHDRVLIVCKNGAFFVGFWTRDYNDDARWHIYTALGSSRLLNKGRVTHWMPLPESPQEG